MTIQGTIRAAALSAAIMAGSTPGAIAESLSIYQATLGETSTASPEISTEQMRRILSDGSAVVLDTRTKAEFDAGHIPGAHALDVAPEAHLTAVERLVKGDKSAALVLYCNGPFCQASRRLAGQLVNAGFTNVRRYQLGIPVWRALGGPTAIELGGVVRVYNSDKSAVLIDTRPQAEFAKGSIGGALSAPLGDITSGKLKKIPLPEDDFNRRIVLFGAEAGHARRLAEILSSRPWHNVAYFPGTFETLSVALKTR
jgi:rhodanese-related sulfurtransferase